jgi:hypothetical protein
MFSIIIYEMLEYIDTYIKALQIKWILRLLENSNDNWKSIPQKYFENIGENFLIFNMNLDSFKSLENELSKNQFTFTKYLPLYFIYLFPHIICFLISLKFCGLLFSLPLQVIF